MKTEPAFSPCLYQTKNGSKYFVYCIILLLSLFQQSATGQKPSKAVLFKNGPFTGERNVQTGKLTSETLRDAHYKGNYYILIQFDKLPGIFERNELSRQGIRLFDYIPGDAFLAEIPENFALADLKKYMVGGVYINPAHLKISEKIRRRLEEQPGRWVGDADEAIAVGFFGTIAKTDVIKEVEQAGATILPSKIQPDYIVFIRSSATTLQKIAGLPFISFLGLQSLKPVPINYNNRATHSVAALGASSGRNLQGAGVTVGIGDNADPSTHADFTGRLILRTSAAAATHGTHTAGILAGGGILDPRYKGMAPKATLISQYFTDIIASTPVYIADYNMVLTNNSYSNAVNGCPGEGEYDALSNYVDAQLKTYPALLHVFAAGNDGTISCIPYPGGFATIKSGLQCGKNILTVGNILNTSYTISGTSSRGPVYDGRIKPEIVTGGNNIISTFPNNSYAYNSGTSMSSPAATGILALLYERYRQLHGGADPTGALIKAITCNSATDLGNPGPDYTYGFGMLNARTAVETIENNNYFTGSVNQAGTATYTITGVPAGTQQLKILLYWPDPAAAPFAASALVNNLDLSVLAPNSIFHYPLILNPAPANVADNAVEGIDNTNNIEQVVINNPPAGNFTVTVNGTSIPSGAQNYVIAYQVINPSVTVEYPFGNETWVPGQTENIRWTAYGGDPNTFTIDYSTNNGSTWNTISTTAPSTSRTYAWTVPSTATNQALVRVTRNSTGYSSSSTYAFTILDQPVITVSNPCQGYAQLNWSPVPAATSYEVMKLMGDSMQTVATTTGTTYLLGNLNRNSSYWLSVRAINNTTPGRRSLAAAIRPAGGACSLPALDKDFTLDSLVAPLTGRMYTSSQLTSVTALKVELKNLGTTVSTGSYNLSYQVNGGAVTTEISSTAIAPNTAYTYTFTNTYNFSAAGIYTLKIWVDYAGDPQLGNDTLTAVVKQLQNDPITLSPVYTEGFESATAQSYTIPTKGFDGIDRCDFSASDPNGRARTFINTGFARTGNRCVTLDQLHTRSSSTADSLVTTFNFSGYSATDQLWLDFYYKNQGIDFNLPGNQVWIRGNDQAAWLPVYTLNTDPALIGIYQPATSIDITGVLVKANPVQTLSSSFQIKFGEQGYTSANSVIPDGNLDDGYSFDDISLTRSANDLGMRTLVSPVFSNTCALTNAETISVKVRNYSSAPIANIPVIYAINGVMVTENIPVINAFDSVIYTFTRKADLSAYRKYNLAVWVNYSGDNYHWNDSLTNISFLTTPLITSFPYLEGFEANNGYWYSDGINNSWQWGTPAKTVINKAAGGNKAWVTSLNGTYNNNELSYLYSPCFDLSGLANPVLSFSHIFQTEDNCDCDYHWAEYSIDGTNWTKLGTTGTGTNWYDYAAIQAWKLSDIKWHVSSYDIPSHAAKVRFRIVMNSDPGVTYDGIGIDDVHVFDKASVYSGPDISSGISQPVSGNNWVNFDMGGHRIVSINPNGQDLGNTRVNVYINTGAVRDTNNRYYLDRNIVIQPANPPGADVTVRYYFLDSEANKLINASGCTACATIPDAYQATVMQYSSPVLSEENGTLKDDTSGTFQFLLPHKDVRIIPYDNGYYAEYNVTGFSEFWIDSGGPAPNQPLALLSFTATKTGNSALLIWRTAYESNTSRYIIEKSSDSVHFSGIDSVKATGNNTINLYQYTDKVLWKGFNHYRLRMVGLNGLFKYSPVRSINYTDGNLVISIYPNPVSNGSIYINTSVNCRSIRVYDISGRLVTASTTPGFLHRLYLGNLARGIYLISVETDAGKKMEKILVE